MMDCIEVRSYFNFVCIHEGCKQVQQTHRYCHDLFWVKGRLMSSDLHITLQYTLCIPYEAEATTLSAEITELEFPFLISSLYLFGPGDVFM